MTDILLTEEEIAEWLDNRFHPGHMFNPRFCKDFQEVVLHNVLRWLERRNYWISIEDVQELRKAAGFVCHRKENHE